MATMRLIGLTLLCFAGLNSVVSANSIGDNDRDGVINARDFCVNTPVGFKVDNRGCKQLSKLREQLALDIDFKNGSAYIHPKYHAEIESIARRLLKQPQAKVTLIGQASDVGHPTINHSMSLERAKRVALVLIEKFNIPPTRLKVSTDQETSVEVDKFPTSKRRVIVYISQMHIMSHQDYLGF